MAHLTSPLARAARRLRPRASDYRDIRTSWRSDLLAGVTVGVVALPLALGFGVASGVGPAAGIVTAIVAGIVAAVFGGSAVQVSGPTGAMAVVLAPIVATDGVSAVTTVAVMAGVMVLIMGVAGLGRSIQFVPWPVLEGFTVGIAVTIALQQVPLVVGQPKATGTSVLGSAASALRTLSPSSSGTALLLAASVIVIMMLWPKVTLRIPASIVAVTLVTIPAAVLHLSVPTIGTLPGRLPLPRMPDLSPSIAGHLLGPALAVAVLASIESLLSARVADAMTGVTRTSDDRELVGQGLANVASGLFGGMPATGAIARTAVNVRAGAQTRVAAITHAVVITLVVLLAAPVVSCIPLTVLGAVLIMTAVKMFDYRRVRLGLIAHKSESIVFALTALVTILLNLVTAIEVGLVVAGAMALRATASASGATQEELADHHDGPVDQVALLSEHIAIFRFDGALFFGAVPRFLTQLRAVQGVSVVILRLKGMTFIDASGTEALSQIIDELERRGITLLIKGVGTEHSMSLTAAGVLAPLLAKGHLFDDLDAAVAHARRHVEGPDQVGGLGVA